MKFKFCVVSLIISDNQEKILYKNLVKKLTEIEIESNLRAENIHFKMVAKNET